MVSAVLAADAFAGEKERRTLEAPAPPARSRDRDLFLAKLLGAFVPAIGGRRGSGSCCFAVVANAVGVAGDAPDLRADPAVDGDDPLGGAGGGDARPGVMVRVSARARTSQEANQLGGAVILPLIFLAVGQSTGLLLVALPVAIAHRRGASGWSPLGSSSAAAPRASPATPLAAELWSSELSRQLARMKSWRTAAPRMSERAGWRGRWWWRVSWPAAPAGRASTWRCVTPCGRRQARRRRVAERATSIAGGERELVGRRPRGRRRPTAGRSESTTRPISPGPSSS